MFGGAGYAYSRESLRASVPEIYRETNTKFFNGELPTVPIAITDLSSRDTETDIVLATTYFDGVTTINIDLNRIHSEAQLREVISHEACHLYEGPSSDEHGVAFQACMLRFN